MNIQIPALVRTVASFLEGCSFFITVKDATSDPQPIHAGVPQGSCLSPCLYAIYTSDIPTLVGQLQEWEEDIVLALYADDIFASSRRADLAVAKLQRVLDLLPDWLDKWRVAVNMTKTAALLTGQQRIMPPKLRLRGQEVEWQTRVRNLSVQIDRSMRMVAQVEHDIYQSRAAQSMLRPVLRSYLPLRAKVALYKGYIYYRTLLHITNEEDPSPAEHRSMDDHGSGTVNEWLTPSKRTPQDASPNPKLKPGRLSRREMGLQMHPPLRGHCPPGPVEKTPEHEVRVDALPINCIHFGASVYLAIMFDKHLYFKDHI
ncbi:RNA-directed DNA polymerase from mobile element jockey [Eumeta japonica]|uniref:RNA-directed DNA polymerase from mobile element jockey n=1 Tax=Eumeta variegata TaxID=151549 RepID=A0A4C1UZD9_EUMVA|nr:RNA-directed DNA polymerase from mobile element jockey [Eumeta japonica]